ncbi:hypothetical protein Q73_15950 [Bacillus coahuilensis m2-6]|uniref:DUF58 domain-containing protein n=1 Tax=Bacillus coahuilensis TaxID=408580 RepID=UPI0001850700|nr:DUF58 domain-containing protein [Bacillus coahuilensis]KUP04363.1 hypothetical protein Q73_15950 [Bacillus coahuilensis m2-6]
MKHQFLLLKAIGKFFVVLAFMVITFSYAMFQGGFVSWFLFYSFLPFAGYSLLLFLYPLSSLDVTRELKTKAWKAGEPLTVVVTIRRRFPFPLFYLLIEDVVTPSMFKHSPSDVVKTVIYPMFKRKIQLEYTIQSIARGEHVFAGIRIQTGDIFGLFSKERFVPVTDEVLVYPSFVEIPYRPVENKYDQGAAKTENKFQKDTTMVTGVRDYQGGDRFSWIHWKTFARTNELKTKEFEEKQSHDVLVLLDRSPSEQFEELVSFTASIIRAIVKKGAQVGLLSLGKVAFLSGIREGQDHLNSLFYHLAKVEGDSIHSFGKALEKEGVVYQQSATILFLTTRIGRGDVDALYKYAKHNPSIVIFLVKKRSQSLSTADKNMLAFASSRGIRVKVVYEDGFEQAFLEVKRA